jgi:hypothetical protein
MAVFRCIRVMARMALFFLKSLVPPLSLVFLMIHSAFVIVKLGKTKIKSHVKEYLFT